MIVAEVQQLLSALQAITEDAVANLITMDTEALEHLADQRQAIVDQLETHRNDIDQEDRKQIAYILSFDFLILERMNLLREEAGEWIQKQGAIKTQHSAYQSAYSVDSLFFDRRE